MTTGDIIGRTISNDRQVRRGQVATLEQAMPSARSSEQRDGLYERRMTHLMTPVSCDRWSCGLSERNFDC